MPGRNEQRSEVYFIYSEGVAEFLTTQCVRNNVKSPDWPGFLHCVAYTLKRVIGRVSWRSSRSITTSWRF